MPPSRWDWAEAAAVLALASIVAWSQAVQDLRDDDWEYVAWAQAHPGVSAIWAHPPPYPYLRPLNALVWQIQGHFGSSPWPAEAVLVALWIAATCLFAAAARRAGGPGCGLAAVLLLLLMPEYRTLPNWRSWLTTTGGLLGVAGALWVTRSRVSPWWALLPLAIGAGFKEVSWLYGAAVLAAAGAWGPAGLALGLFAAHFSASPFHPGQPQPLDQLRTLVDAWVRWGWPLGVAAAGLAAGTRRERATVAAGLLCAAPGLAFHVRNPTYFVEGAAVVLVGGLPAVVRLARARPRATLAVALPALVWACRPSAWSDYAENVPWQRHRMQVGRELARQAAGAGEVWAKDPPSPCDLAARILVVDHGATRVEEPPVDGVALSEGCLVVGAGTPGGPARDPVAPE